jgi:crossover junction endodeoxyribonuclease RuvC
MRVLGIDPGTVRMGYGVIEGGPQPRAEDYGVIGLSKSMPLEQRLYQLYTHVLNLIHLFSPDVVAVEEPFVGRGERYFAGPAIAVGQAQGVVLIGAAGQGLPIYRYSPAQIKLAIVDYGAATKAQVQQTILAILDLKQLPESDAADALSVGLCHLNHSQADSTLAREIPPGQER